MRQPEMKLLSMALIAMATLYLAPISSRGCTCEEIAGKYFSNIYSPYSNTLKNIKLKKNKSSTEKPFVTYFRFFCEGNQLKLEESTSSFKIPKKDVSNWSSSSISLTHNVENLDDSMMSVIIGFNTTTKYIFSCKNGKIGRFRKIETEISTP
jgi:hypothetical protein